MFQVRSGTEYSEIYMKSIIKNVVLNDGQQRAKVGVMVMPGFMVGGSVIQSQVYLTDVMYAE
ncbi:hypothetical protein KSP40_PGU006041 [Platanthera guangdongensis]|uniref:GIL1/IRKI C-terminal domain-containing protein n=1 Tax=Platanthera guangdongensis TaxID=2320717 RepID=A0ABR2MST3_9ASPA